MPRFINGPTRRLVHIGDDGVTTDLTDMLASAPDRPERGRPYSVSWYEDGKLLRRDRVYVVREDYDPARFVVVDTHTGEQLNLYRDSMPLFRAPTKPHPHRLDMEAFVERNRDALGR